MELTVVTDKEFNLDFPHRSNLHASKVRFCTATKIRLYNLNLQRILTLITCSCFLEEAHRESAWRSRYLHLTVVYSCIYRTLVDKVESRH
jgi:hypothetical protein